MYAATHKGRVAEIELRQGVKHSQLPALAKCVAWEVESIISVVSLCINPTIFFDELKSKVHKSTLAPGVLRLQKSRGVGGDQLLGTTHFHGIDYVKQITQD